MHCMIVVTALILSLSHVGVRDLLAQRRGFIVGFGLGAAVTTWTERFGDSPVSDSESEVGVATDFKIGAQVSQSVQVYYVGRANWFVPEGGSSLFVTGISALGATYVLPSAPVHLSGGVGLATWDLISASSSSFVGFGLTGGIGWEFADKWLLDIAMTYGIPDSSGRTINMFMARAGISILSH